MKIREEVLQLDSSLWTHETHQRTDGVHVSSIIHELEKVRTGKDRGEGWDEEKLEPYRIAGFLFERALFDVLLKDEETERPGEIEKDGVILSPDAIRVSSWRLIEAKATWQSMPSQDNGKQIIRDWWRWWTQIQAYLHALGMTEVELWTMWMNGDYRKLRAPRVRVWVAKFEKEELRGNWKMILEKGKGLGWL